MLRAKGKSRCQGSLLVSRLYAWQIQCPSYALVLWLEAFFDGHVVLIQVRSRFRNSGIGRVSLACVNECLLWGHFASMNQTPDSPFIKAEPFTKFGNWRSLAINGHYAIQPCVAVLLLARGPSAITRRVRPVVVLAFKSEFG